MKTISVLVPTYNEEDNVKAISEAIITQMELLDSYDYELIFIDNDSKDNTRSIIRELCKNNPKIKAIFNAKNFGQFNSPYYGILQATGDCVIAMSADFQDPVELIPQFIEEWEKGFKIVMGQKTSSKEKKIVYALRSFYYSFMKKHSEYGFIKQVTGFGLYDREFIEIMRRIDDPHPFLRGVVTELGYKIQVIPFEQPLRKAGKSSNSVYRYYDAAVQSFTAYTKTGIRLITLVGLIASIISTVSFIGGLIYKLIYWDEWEGGMILISLLLFMSISWQMLFLGIIGEYVLNINSYMKRRPIVVESERINM